MVLGWGGQQRGRLPGMGRGARHGSGAGAAGLRVLCIFDFAESLLMSISFDIVVFRRWRIPRNWFVLVHGLVLSI